MKELGRHSRELQRRLPDAPTPLGRRPVGDIPAIVPLNPRRPDSLIPRPETPAIVPQKKASSEKSLPR